jgi:hypothetical protein
MPEAVRTFVARPDAPVPFGLEPGAAGGRTGPGVLQMSDEDLAHVPPTELAELFSAEVPAGAALPTSFAGTPQPRILAEGDSWFAYPKTWILLGAPSNIILQLVKLGGYTIHSMAANGDEAVEMLSGERERLVDALAADPYDAVLFSGGGNDIVGKYNIDYLVRKPSAGVSGAALIDAVKFQRRMDEVKHAYLDLLDLVARFSKNPNAPIITHTYDRAIPSGKAAKFVGGLVSIKAWIKPYLDPMGISPPDQQAIIDAMLAQFQAMLLGIEAAFPNRFHVVRTNPTVAANEWANEIHPNPAGFRKIAIKVKAVLDAVI